MRGGPSLQAGSAVATQVTQPFVRLVAGQVCGTAHAGADTLGLAMGTEIERKFRLSELPASLREGRSEDIEQGYLAICEDGTEVRLRRLGDGAFLTVKRGEGEKRLENEIELDRDQFDALWPLTEGRRLSKTRHYLPHGPLTIEIDVYRGELSGMVVGEVEFDSDGASAAFDPPAWLGTEVTGDRRYANKRLAVHGAPEG